MKGQLWSSSSSHTGIKFSEKHRQSSGDKCLVFNEDRSGKCTTVFAFAGLWRHHQAEMQDPDSDRDTYAVITTMTNALIEPVYPAKMPVIWSLQSYDTWLYGTEQDAFRLLKRFPCGEMRIAKQGVGLWSDALYEY